MVRYARGHCSSGSNADDNEDDDEDEEVERSEDTAPEMELMYRL